jgi:YD repeat-containing protein
MKNGTYEVVIENGREYWRKYDANGNCIHYKDSDDYEYWYEYDSNGNHIHFKDSNGYKKWYEYDSNGNMIHSKSLDGEEHWYDSNGNEITKEEFARIHGSCDGKIVTIEGKNYQLKEIK